MSSVKGHLFRLLSTALLQRARVTSVERAGAFVEIELDAMEDLRPGDKVQVLLPSHDVRTYTPIVGPRPRLLVHLHAETPGPQWAASACVGDELRFKGPERCIDLPEGAVSIVGDETSIATALSYANARPGRVTSLIEADAPFEGVLTFARGDHAAIASAVPSEGAVAITGGAALVRGVRDALRARGLRPTVKTYWAPGRRGLD